MKILLVSGIYPPDIGGPATFIPELEVYLKSAGHKVRVVSLTENPKQSAILFPGNIFINRNIAPVIRQMVSIFRIAVASFRMDAVFANGLFEEAAISQVITRKRLVTKVVGDPVWERYKNSNPEADSLGIEDFNNLELQANYRFQRHLLVWALGRSAAICTPSGQLANFINRWGIRKQVVVIPNGVPIPKNLNSKSQIKFDIVTVSRLVKWKNVDVLIEACASAHLSLAIVGDGPEFEKLELLARKKKSEVHFLGTLNGEALNEILSASRIFALYSNYEGMSFALVSAMMLGMRIVASNIEGNRNAITDGVEGRLVSPMNVFELQNMLEEVNMDSQRNNTMARNAQTKALNVFSIGKCLDSTFHLISAN